MLAIQSLYSLGLFGAQNFAYIGIALCVTREFSPLIMGILIAGRSGSAIAARLATMTINQEIDALQVMGINPVRFLVAPMLIALRRHAAVSGDAGEPGLDRRRGPLRVGRAGHHLRRPTSTRTVQILVDDVMHGISKSSFFGAADRA